MVEVLLVMVLVMVVVMLVLAMVLSNTWAGLLFSVVL